MFARRLPDGRRYGVVAGTGRLPGAVQRFRFDDADLAHLSDHHVVDDSTLEWLREYRFSGCISGYAEGECYLPNSPVLAVEGSFAEAVLLETLVLSVLNHDSAVAAAASRMTAAAEGRPCIEMGSRRTHEEAAVAAARAAYVAGFGSTSNLEAGRRYGVPTSGTSAHAFTLLHDDERAAFEAQVASQGAGTTLLVDTYDVEAAVRLAVEVAGRDLGAVRLDSGDLLAQARQVREQARRPGQPRHPDHRHQRPRRVRDRRARRRPGRRVRRRHAGSSSARAPRPRAWSTSLVARENAAGEPRGRREAQRRQGRCRGRKHAGRLVVDGVAQAEVLRPWPREVEGERPLQVEPGARRRGGAPRAARRRPRPAPRLAGRASAVRPPPVARRARDPHPLRAGDPVTRALVVVDVQHDFVEGVRSRWPAAPTSRAPWPRTWRPSPTTTSWRRRTTTSTRAATSATTPTSSTSWPPHCVVGTDGVEPARRACPRPPRGAVPQGRARRGVLRVRGVRRAGHRAGRLAAGARRGRRRRRRHRHRPLRAGHRARRGGGRLHDPRAARPDRRRGARDDRPGARAACARPASSLVGEPVVR
nr:hypothetical protein [Angustibacter aerolatus]